MSIHYTQAMSAVIISLLASQGASAATVTDNRGNVGYDTLEQCEAAAAAGTAKTYQPFTRNQPRLRKNETSLTVLPLKEVTLTPDVVKAMNFTSNTYQLGACDLGVGPQGIQSGVSKPLQGKYVYFSPDTPVNVYRNKDGFPVRATMQQCDNRFALDLPRPIPVKQMAEVPTSPATNYPQTGSIDATQVNAAIGQTAAGATEATTAIATAAAAITPVAVESGVLLAAGPFALTQALSAIGLVAAGAAVLLYNSGDTGTTGTTGTTSTNP
jgi:hypothetical protein